MEREVDSCHKSRRTVDPCGRLREKRVWERSALTKWRLRRRGWQSTSVKPISYCEIFFGTKPYRGCYAFLSAGTTHLIASRISGIFSKSAHTFTASATLSCDSTRLALRSNFARILSNPHGFLGSPRT